MKSLGLLILLLVCLSIGEKTRYDNHQVIRVNLSREQVTFIDSLGLDVWNDHLSIGQNDIRVSPDQLEIIRKMGITYDVLIPNVQALIDEEEKNQKVPSQSFFDQYQRYDAIVNYLINLGSTYNQITTYVPSIGTSIEGRDIPALTISVELGKNASSSLGPKPTIFVTGGQHAREWISPATVLFILNTLLDQYGTDPQITAILNEFNYIFIPLANPDGYEFSQTTTRLWRKNRRNNGDGSFGVDLNRNWDYEWGGPGSSADPSSDIYRGASPFSEPETTSLSKYYLNAPGNILAALDYHSYGQLILRPWGDTTNNPPNNANLTLVGTGIRNAIIASGGVPYTSQKASELYPASGTAQDWYFVNTSPTYSLCYTIELRDTGTYGFVLPSTQIVPTGKENVAGFLFFAEFLRNQF